MLDEFLLDEPEALARADAHGLLRGAAQAGARVRTALRYATESGLDALNPEGRPRGILVAGPGPATACVAGLLGAFTHGAVPVTLIAPTGARPEPGALRWSLPGWAGPLDLLLITTPDGTEPGLTPLVEQAYRRGCTVVAVSPQGAPLAAGIGETRGLSVPLAPPPQGAYEVQEAGAGAPGGADGADKSGNGGAPLAAPGTLWAMLTPVLLLCGRLGLVQADTRALEAVADRLDEVAERCGPAIETYSNAAKTLAAELAGTLPLLWSEGEAAHAVARHAASTLTGLPGYPALAAGLPEAMTAHGALLRGAFGPAPAEEDFFRDRVEEPEPRRVRVVLLREHAPDAESAVVAARDLAYGHEAPVGELEPAEGSGPLEAAAELIATTDFAAVYLALADNGS
ncbi:SIS domain-containing protein [Streptomyces sp. ODS28]|uniref:SIS domain-containing protein n=1 Tax=Streptomyces sp. ODS28 TaxID=3136688 RepID=UPI0031EF9B2C